MGLKPVRKLTVLLLLPIAGCGGGEEATSTVQDAKDSTTTLLIQKGDLPPGKVKAESIPEPCSPIPLLEQQNAEVAGTPLLSLEDGSVAEVVGVVPSVGKARQALAELEDRKRMVCIRSTIVSFGPQEGEYVNIGQSEATGEGDEGSTVQISEVDSESKPINFTTVVSLRSGRCVATLLFLTQAGKPKGGFVNGLTDRAYERLEDAHSTCR